MYPHGSSEENCHIRCRKRHQTGHIAKNCASNRRVTVGKTMIQEVELNEYHAKGVLDCGSERTLRQESLNVLGCAMCDITISDTGGKVNLEVLIVACSDKVLLGTDFLRAAEISIDFATGNVTCFGVPVHQAPVTVCRCVVEADCVTDGILEEDVLYPKQFKKEKQVQLGNLPKDKEEQVRQVLSKYDVFTREGMELGKVDVITHDIKLCADPKKKKVYPVPPALREVAAGQVKDMLKNRGWPTSLILGGGGDGIGTAASPRIFS